MESLFQGFESIHASSSSFFFFIRTSKFWPRLVFEVLKQFEPPIVLKLFLFPSCQLYMSLVVLIKLFLLKKACRFITCDKLKTSVPIKFQIIPIIL